MTSPCDTCYQYPKPTLPTAVLYHMQKADCEQLQKDQQGQLQLHVKTCYLYNKERVRHNPRTLAVTSQYNSTYVSFSSRVSLKLLYQKTHQTCGTVCKRDRGSAVLALPPEPSTGREQQESKYRALPGEKQSCWMQGSEKKGGAVPQHGRALHPAAHPGVLLQMLSSPETKEGFQSVTCLHGREGW